MLLFKSNGKWTRKNKNEVEELNILIAINEAWLIPARTLIASIKDSNKDIKINIFVLYSDLSSDAILELNNDSTELCTITTIKVDDADIKNAPRIERISKETYLRLYASIVLPQNLDRIMWIDADAVVTQTLSEFYEQNIDNYYYAAYVEVSNLSGKRNARLENLHLPENFPYINAGVLLINLHEIRKIKTWVEDINEYIKKTDSDLKYADQDIINVLFNANGKVKVINSPCIYNQRATKQHYRKPYAILHYVGKKKPWLTTGLKGFLLWYKYAFKIQGKRLHVIKLFCGAIFKGICNLFKK